MAHNIVIAAGELVLKAPRLYSDYKCSNHLDELQIWPCFTMFFQLEFSSTVWKTVQPFFFCRLQLLAVGSNNKGLKNMSYIVYEILVTSQLNSAHYAPLSSFINHEAGGGRGCDMLFLSWMTLSSPNVWDVVQNTPWLLHKQYKHRFKGAFSPISL